MNCYLFELYAVQPDMNMLPTCLYATPFLTRFHLSHL